MLLMLQQRNLKKSEGDTEREDGGKSGGRGERKGETKIIICF